MTSAEQATASETNSGTTDISAPVAKVAWTMRLDLIRNRAQVTDDKLKYLRHTGKNLSR